MSYWAKTYGPGVAKAVAVDKNGDIIVVGEREGDGFVARLDKDGNVKWFKTYGGNGDDYFEDVKIAPNGDIIVAGETYSFGAGKSDVWVLRLDSNGNVIWQKTYGGNYDDEASALALTPNGDIIVAGYTYSFGAGEVDFWVLRLDSQGNVIWEKTYGGSDLDWATAVAVAPNGDIIVAGWTDSFGAGSYDVWVLRLDSNGNVIWQKTYGGKYSEEAWAVALASNGDIIVAGANNRTGAGSYDVWVLRLDSNGNVIWQKTYGGSDWDKANALALTPNGDIIVAGVTGSFGAGGRDVWVLKLDGNGNVIWEKTYGGSDYDGATAVAVAPNGDIIVAGWTKSFGAGSADVWVLRLPPDGKLKGFSKESEAEMFSSSATITETQAYVSEGYAEKEVEEEEEVWETVGRIFKKKVKKTVKVKKKIRILPQCQSSSAKISLVRAEVSVIYDFSNPKIFEFWKLISEDQLDKAAELFEVLHPKIAEALVKLFVPRYLVLEKEHENAGTAEVLLGVSNPYLSRLKVKVSLKNDKYFTPERDSFTFTLKKGESFARRVKVTRAKNEEGEYRLRWMSFDAVFEFPEYGVRERKQLSLSDETEMAYVLAMLETNLAKKLELLRKAVSLGHEEARKELEKLEKQLEPLKQNIQNSLTLSVPGLVEGADSIIKLTAKNDFTNSLKLSLDLSSNDFFELETTSLEFPELKKGHKVSKSLAVTPKYAGNFDFRVKIKAIADGIEVEDEKIIPVEVGEKIITPVQTPVTPQQITPTTPAATPSHSYPTITSFPAGLLSVYEPLEELGRGGFARVYKVKRKKDGEVVAVKIPLSLDPATGKSFLREIENWTKLKHPNIVRVFDYNILPVPFFEMEFCESSLEKLPKPMEPKEAALLIFNIAEGLKYAHSRGIIHRDLKPSNILLKNGTPKISDWGLSKAMAETHSTTLASFTPFYASPEQTSRRFGKPDHRSDIWQLGVIFYQLVTGRLPFEGDDLIEVVSRIATDEPVPPGELNPEAKDVEHIILTCLQKDKEERYQSVAELQFELATYLGVRYKEQLKRSITLNDAPRAAFYAGKLMLMFLKMGNLKEAYKYASDLKFYARGELSGDVEALAEQIKMRLEEGLSFAGEELLAKAEIIAHKVSLGFKEV